MIPEFVGFYDGISQQICFIIHDADEDFLRGVSLQGIQKVSAYQHTIVETLTNQNHLDL